MPAQIRELHAGGLGRRAIAKRVTEETGRPCTHGVMLAVFRQLQLSPRRTKSTPEVEVRDVSPHHPDDGDVPIEELIEARIEAAAAKRLKATAHKRTIELPCEPFGVMVFGDPHVDNEGCDWASLADHVKLVQKTSGVLAACVGDVQDNWIGRLQRLYANSSATASDGWRLSEWYLESMQWLALVGGNHDAWAHGPGTDPLKALSKKARVLCYAPDEVRMELIWKGGRAKPIDFMLRHDFRGRSWFHPTHGPAKEALLDGKCHVLGAGHIHQWGQLSTEQRHGRVTHAFRVRGYKRDDAHARSLGFYEQKHGESCLVVLNPTASEPGRIQLFWDLEHGCDYLSWLRKA